jgi:putative transposase
MNKQHVQLDEADRASLKNIISKGELSARIYKRALALLELDRGKTYTAVAQTMQVNQTTVSIWGKKYHEQGLHMLLDQSRSGRPPVIDGEQRAKVTALACSTPPTGYARWSLRLLAEKIVELGYVENISHTEVGKILKKTS